MAMRKRSGSGAKRQHKCKLVPIYESFFKGEDLTLAHPNFWNELFLIKPMVRIFLNLIYIFLSSDVNNCNK